MAVLDKASTTPARDRLLALLGASGGLALLILSYFAVPRFKRSAANLGIELPTLTRLLFDYYPATWLIPPLLVLITWHCWPSAKRRGLAACLSGICGAVLVHLVALAAVQMAVYQAAAAI